MLIPPPVGRVKGKGFSLSFVRVQAMLFPRLPDLVNLSVIRERGRRMSDALSPEQQIRQEIADAFKRKDYLEGYTKGAKQNPGGFLQTHLPILAPYLTSCSVERQEQVLEQMKDQSARIEKANKKTFRLTLGIAVFSLALSVLAAAGTYFSIRSSSQWQQEQIPLLQKIADNQSLDIAR